MKCFVAKSKEKGPPGGCRVVPGVRAALSSVCLEYLSPRRSGELAEIAVPLYGLSPSYSGKLIIAKVESTGELSECMFTLTTTQNNASVLPLWNAVFCLDCEAISNSRSEECPACKSRSLVSLSRMLGGSLRTHRALQEHDGVLFDIVMSIELQQMHPKDVSATIERITTVIAPKLAREGAAFHVNVKPRVDKPDAQAWLHFQERDAA
jgi:hypothetical protein